jgi:SAM-dependent methyltransferase
LETHHEKHGVKIYSRIEDIDQEFDVVTMFHVLEHLSNPVKTLENIKHILSKNGKLIIEVPNSDDALYRLYESKEFAKMSYWSCHLNLFNASTLTLLAKRLGCNVDFVKQIQRYPLSNHLHWLAKGDKGGHEKWGFLDSPELHSAYEKRLASIGMCDTVIAMYSLT